VAAHHLLDDAGAQPRREPLTEVTGVVRDERELLDAALDDAADQRLGISRQPEPADEDRHAVAQRLERRRDAVDDLVRMPAPPGDWLPRGRAGAPHGGSAR